MSCCAHSQFIFPVDCKEGKDCWVVNYMDVDPVPDSARDFRCGQRSYDNHKGTDIAIRDWKAMLSGVDVLAVADGTVLRLRDGVEDKVLSREQLTTLLEQNRACGNGVVIDHGEGWQTMYCHLKKNSIVVNKNNTVKTGQKIGQVGHSGYVEFPHLHIGVMRNDVWIDPYTGRNNREGCGLAGRSIWSKEVLSDYTPVSIYATGFKDDVPEYEDIKRDVSSPKSLSLDSPALTFWAVIFGIEKNDQIHMEIRDPKGQMFSQRDITQGKTRARQFFYVGRKNRKSALIEGTYTGIITLTRVLTDGEIIKRTVDNELFIK
jgi:hypothetical protein